jgi:enamine deaminase RidA (YjgF/YER057c/UK114 family)
VKVEAGGRHRRSAISVEGRAKPRGHYSPAIRAGDWVFLSGQLATDFVHGIAPEAQVEPGLPYYADELQLQSRYLLKQLAGTLQAAGGDLARDTIRMWQWVVAPNQRWQEGDAWTGLSFQRYLDEWVRAIPTDRPASTAMGVRQLLCRGAVIEADLMARLPVANESRVAYDYPPDLPAPIAKYAPAIRQGDWVFTCGEVPVDWRGDFMTSGPRMGNPEELGSLAPQARVNPYHWYDVPIRRQTEYTLDKLQRLVESIGTSFDRCVRAEVYLSHPREFYGMDEVWRRYFPNNPPARVVIPYMGLTGRGCKIEIALTLVMPSSSLKVQTIETDRAPRPTTWEPQAVRAGDLLFFSTQLAADEHGLAREVQRDPDWPFHDQLAKRQMRYVLQNIEAICEAAGTSLDNLVQRQCFYASFDDFAASTEEWASHFPEAPPASTTVEIGGPLQVPGCLFLLNLVGYVPGDS